MKKYLFISLLGFCNSTVFSQIYAVGNGDGHAISCVFWDFGAVVLPVSLLSFDAVCSDDKAKLQWSIPSDINNHNFTIERSTDGINFQTLSSVYSKEAISGKYYFSFIDETVPAVRTYYRLRQPVDNHQFDYSRVITADCSQTNYPGISLYPNPTKGLINIKTNSANTILIVRNSVGQLLLHKEAKPVSTTVNLSQFQDGIYYIEIRSFNNSTYHKIVLNKN